MNIPDKTAFDEYVETSISSLETVNINCVFFALYLNNDAAAVSDLN